MLVTTFEHALAVLPFGNTLVVLDLTGEELVAALDRGSPSQGEVRFPQVAGLTLIYCTEVPCPAALRPGGQITALTVNGVPVDSTAHYRIAINSYMAGGGDGYAMLKAACARPGGYCRDTGLLDLDLLVEAFQNAVAAGPTCRGAHRGPVTFAVHRPTRRRRVDPRQRTTEPSRGRSGISPSIARSNRRTSS